MNYLGIEPTKPQNAHDLKNGLIRNVHSVLLNS